MLNPVKEHLDDAPSTAEEELQETTIQYVTFSIDQEEYGVDILKVREIKGWSETTRIPGAPNWVCGVMNLRGEIAPIIDIRKKFDMAQTLPGKNNVVVIVDVDTRIIGLLVDCVSDIVSIPESLIQPVPGVERTKDSEYLVGISILSGRLVSLLDLSKFVQELGRNDIRLAGGIGG